jgi:hypothetical protein
MNLYVRVRSNPSRRRCGPTAFSPQWWVVGCCALALLVTMQLPATNAFSVMMMSSPLSSSDKYSYQPPVKTSVEQLQKFSRPNKRFAVGSGSGSSGNGGGSSGSGGSTDRSTAHAAVAGGAALSMPPMGGRSFEERMRDLVLGPTTNGAGQKQTKWETHRTTTTTARSSVLPPNVQCIESLQDYKRVVGDEREKIVAVRFYANYCKVRFIHRGTGPMRMGSGLSLAFLFMIGLPSGRAALLSAGETIPRHRVCRCTRNGTQYRSASRPGYTHVAICSHLSSHWKASGGAQANAQPCSRL